MLSFHSVTTLGLQQSHIVILSTICMAFLSSLLPEEHHVPLQRPCHTTQYSTLDIHVDSVGATITNRINAGIIIKPRSSGGVEDLISSWQKQAPTSHIPSKWSEVRRQSGLKRQL